VGGEEIDRENETQKNPLQLARLILKEQIFFFEMSNKFY
jgi:hypothetical protein